jgi:hypothetical protein
LIRDCRWESLICNQQRITNQSRSLTGDALRVQADHRVQRAGQRRAPALSRATWCDRNAFAAPAAGTLATTQEKNSLTQPGFWDINMSFRKGSRTIQVGMQYIV